MTITGSKTTVGEYLLAQLKKYGVMHMFGVPGDYILGFLDQVEDDKDIQWIGNCNELNASYAADGYAKIHGMGALAITYGVGELSAINGVAGSLAERVPVVVIVGRPSSAVVKNRAVVHHGLGDGEFEIFHEMFAKVTGTQTVLTVRNAQREIDRVLDVCFREKVPVYIEIGSDITKEEIRIGAPLEIVPFMSNQKTLNSFISTVEKLLKSSKGEFIIGDYEIGRFHLKKEFSDFINKVKIPVTTLSMGKGIVDETSAYFPGTYGGIFSCNNVNDIEMNSDLLFLIGAKFTDTTTAGFKVINPNIKKIEIHPFYCAHDGVIYDNILMKDVLEGLSKLHFKNSIPVKKVFAETFVAQEKNLTQERLYQAIQSYLKQGDVLIAETGTAFFGLSVISLPKDAIFVGQPLWGSIGYCTAASLGTSLADRTRRNILVTGDGSFQLTVQEISTIMRNKLNTIVMVINNDGYTIERVIHGRHRKYNDINMWKYRKIPEALNIDDNAYVSLEVRTEKDLEKAFKACDQNKEKMIFMELYLKKDDVPLNLQRVAEVFKEENKF